MHGHHPAPHHGPAGQATILAVGHAAEVPGHGTVVVKLRLRVRLEGWESYECSSPWEVRPDALRGLRPGTTVAVSVDPDRAQDVHPDVGWARFSVLYSGAWSRPPRPPDPQRATTQGEVG